MNFDALTDYLDTLPSVGIPGLDLIVYQNHREIYRHMTGYRDREAGIPMDGHEIYWLFSASKVQTCAAALQLVEKNDIGLDDPVGDYLPVYKLLSVIENNRVRAAYETLTIRHLFTMQGGFTYNLDSPSLTRAILYSGGKADTRTLIDALAEEPLIFDPGKHFCYSLCHDILAAVIEQVSGLKFSAYLKKNIWDKLGIHETGFVMPDELRPRLMQQYTYDDETHTCRVAEAGNINQYQLTPNYESGGAGLYSSVNDYILFSDALACGGVGKTGRRILKPETIDLMRENQLYGTSYDEFVNALNRPGYSYGLGVRTMIDASCSRGPVGEFGWDGAANAYTLIDPENELSAFYGTHVRGCGYGYHVIQPRIRDLIYEGLEK